MCGRVMVVKVMMGGVGISGGGLCYNCVIGDGGDGGGGFVGTSVGV